MEGNAIELTSKCLSGAKTKKLNYARPKDIQEASKLYGMDLTPQDKSNTAVFTNPKIINSMKV